MSAWPLTGSVDNSDTDIVLFHIYCFGKVEFFKYNILPRILVKMHITEYIFFRADFGNSEYCDAIPAVHDIVDATS